MKSINIWAGCFVILSTFFLFSCGGGGGDSEPGSEESSLDTGPDSGSELTGVFIDSAVQGLAFSTATLSGITNSNGEFTYLAGEQVSFSVGDIIIGQAAGASVVTPVDLVAGAIDETNLVVTHIAQFLQTLDDDGNPDNGINIPTAVSTLASGDFINFESAAFTVETSDLIAEYTASTSAGLRELVSENAAQAHLQINLYQRINGSYSGSYTGTIDYGEGVVPWGGIWEFQIDGSGNVIGQSTDEEGYVGSFTGQINSSGTGVSGGSKDGVRYSLTVGAEGNVSGSWSWVDIDDPAFSGGGSLRGSKSQNQSEESSSNNLISDDADVATGESTWPPTSINEITFPSFSEELAVYDNPSLDSEGDQHWWSFSGQDETFFFYVKTGADHQADDNTHMGCVANVFDQNGNLKYAIDPIRYISADDGFHKNCEIIFTPPDSKTYYLRVKASDDYSTKTGSYTLIATRDRHTAYSTAVNQSKTYTVEGSVLNRNYKISRTFTMPDITELYGLFVLITE